MPVSIFKKNRMIIFIFFMTLLCSGIYANEKPAESCRPYTSDRQQIQCSNLDVFASFLYWHTTETVDWGDVNIVENPNMQTHTFRSVSFDWDPGFRVGAGYNMDHDEWDTQFTYTWYRTRTSDYIHPGPGTIKPAFWGFTMTETEDFLSGELHWTIKFNMFDWDLGRGFWISKKLSMRPFIGLKGGFIDQFIYTNWQNPTLLIASTENLKQNFWGLGPRGGITSKWVLGNVSKYYFSLFEDFAVGFLWGHWKFKDHLYDNLLTNVRIRTANRNFGALMFQSLIGLQLDFNFRQNFSHFTFKLGYEIQDWFNAYQLFDDDTGGHNNDLILQGLNLNLRLDY
jgi:hypothetical protein